MPETVELNRRVKNSAIEVVDYEVDMLRSCFAALGDVLSSTPANTFLVNVLIESYLLHYRGLVEFFCFDRRRYTSTLLLAFSSEWATRALTEDETKAIRHIAQPLADKWFKLIGEQLAHCTHPRYQQKVHWPYVEMQVGMDKVLAEFGRINQLAPYR
jgi:hypothetical protein